MSKKKYIVIASIIILCFLILFVLKVYQNVTTTPIFVTAIGKIRANPSKYEGEDVKIYGEVLKRKSFVALKYFDIKDKTGKITVITSRALPMVGAKLAVKGKVNASFSLGDSQLLVIIQQNKK